MLIHTLSLKDLIFLTQYQKSLIQDLCEHGGLSWKKSEPWVKTQADPWASQDELKTQVDSLASLEELDFVSHWAKNSQTQVWMGHPMYGKCQLVAQLHLRGSFGIYKSHIGKNNKNKIMERYIM